MSLTFEKAYFDGLSGALADIRERNLFPTTYATDHATAANLHWHAEDVLVYLVKGRSSFLDADGNEHQIQAGDLITIPAGTLHAEGAVNEPIVMLIGLVEAVPMDQFLVQRDRDELKE
jgi:gentisate 1,2-dioxygenase